MNNITPTFDTANPVFSFIKLELYFENNGIDDGNKRFTFLLHMLPPFYHAELVQRVAVETIAGADGIDKYQSLKEAILGAATLTSEQKYAQLERLNSLGTLTPREFLYKLKETAPKEAINEAFLRHHLLRTIPQDIKTILAATTFDTVDKLADAATRILQTSQSKVVHNITMPKNTEERDIKIILEENKKMKSELEEMKTQLALLCKERSETNNTRSLHHPAKQPDINYRMRNQPDRPQVCFYHDKYGSKAYRCEPPCKYFRKRLQHSPETRA